MKRFYAEASAEARDGGFIVALDGKAVRTPGKRALRLPTPLLGEAIATEWRDQGDEIAPASMPLTRLANSALDRTAPHRAQVIEQVAAYAGADLLCYRAAGPSVLVERQSGAWQPVLDWLCEVHGAALSVTTGIVPVTQEADALSAVFTVVAGFGDFRLTGLHAATAATGSVALGLALAAGRIGAEETWCTAHLDDLYQAENWGGDEEAERRLDAVRDEIAAAARFLVLCEGDG